MIFQTYHVKSILFLSGGIVFITLSFIERDTLSSYNGSTADFDSVNGGSIPSERTIYRSVAQWLERGACTAIKVAGSSPVTPNINATPLYKRIYF